MPWRTSEVRALSATRADSYARAGPGLARASPRGAAASRERTFAARNAVGRRARTWAVRACPRAGPAPRGCGVGAPLWTRCDGRARDPDGPYGQAYTAASP